MDFLSVGVCVFLFCFFIFLNFVVTWIPRVFITTKILGCERWYCYTWIFSKRPRFDVPLAEGSPFLHDEQDLYLAARFRPDNIPHSFVKMICELGFASLCLSQIT